MLVIIFVQALDNCTIYNTFNPRVIIKNAHSYSDAYLAYTIRFVLVNPDKLYLKYISTYIPAEQTTIEVTFYGYISEICTQEQNNIKWFNQVAIITDIDNYNKLKVEQQYIVFIHEKFSTCGFSYNNQLYRFDISLSVNNQELTILDYSAYRGLNLELSSCTTRKYTDLKSENGIMVANEKDVYFPTVVSEPTLILTNVYVIIALENQITVFMLIITYSINSAVHFFFTSSFK
ncbi:Hypothetical_protein [Hexamita inflata]|uniref:Hypothetical_protein n=1 Tax=Hexamita inflata TaxID=28002 RepID=A0AA86UTB3_9EUKA|nr:Hypothetical protein HINF_LOCUS58455 [Hexamita inflata]